LLFPSLEIKPCKVKSPLPFFKKDC